MNRAARITLNIPYNSLHYHESNFNLAKLHWLPVKFRISFKIAIITFKILSTSQPAYLISLPLEQSTEHSDLHQQSHLTFLQLLQILQLEHYVIWNNLPQEIRSSPSLLIFKKNLKTSYFKLAFKT